MKFTDLSSCVGGINRRDTRLVLCLTDVSGACLGRQGINVRICSQPARDRLHEEKNFRSSETEETSADPNTERYWIMTSSKKNFEALMKVAEILEENSGNNTESWKEEVRVANGIKKKKLI